MPSLLMTLLHLTREDFAALPLEERTGLRQTLYAVLGSTILGAHPADAEPNAAIGQVLAEALLAPPDQRDDALDTRLRALEARLRPAVERARLLACAPDATPGPPPPRPPY